MVNLPTHFLAWKDTFDKHLAKTLEHTWHPAMSNPQAIELLTPLKQAIHHGALLGGKRARPLCTMVVWRGLGQEPTQTALLNLAAAIELIHAQSLVFDDLPCMDDDDWRRGQPTVHKAFDEATAVLAGNALLGVSFGLAAQAAEDQGISAGTCTRLIKELSGVASLNGLVNGQYLDTQAEGLATGDEPLLETIHLNKTAALLRFSLVSPALLAGAPKEVLKALSTLGNSLGLLFQLQDDLLDIEANTETLGKTAGKDVTQGKLTYPKLLGIEGSRQKQQQLEVTIQQCLEVLETQLTTTEPLHELITWLQQRTH